MPHLFTGQLINQHHYRQIMARNWSDFQFRMAKGETVDEIINLNQNQDKLDKVSNSKLFNADVVIGGMKFDLKPMVPNLKQIECQRGKQQNNAEEYVVPSPSIPASQFLPL